MFLQFNLLHPTARLPRGADGYLQARVVLLDGVKSLPAVECCSAMCGWAVAWEGSLKHLPEHFPLFLVCHFQP